MSWNYRVFKREPVYPTIHEKETLYEIREAYYDKNGNINGVSSKSEVVSDSVDGLKWILNKMNECCDKPVIDYDTNKEIKI